MRYRLLDFLACPYDGTFPFILKCNKESFAEIEEGCLVCPTCGRTFPIEGGIPRIVPAGLIATLPQADKVTQDKRTEMRIRDEQTSTFLNWYSEYNTFLELHASLELLALVPSDILLDVGCGIGRITTQINSLCKEVIAVDYSLESLRYLQKVINNGKKSNIHLIQADACLLPFRQNCFDKAISIQVFTLIPSADERIKGLNCVHKSLKQNGVFVMTVFNNHIFRCIKRLRHIPGVFQKEGHHPLHGFYYYNFSVFDLRSFLKNSFSVEGTWGLINLTREFGLRLKIDRYGKLVMWIDRLIQRTPFSYLLGDLLIAKCIKR
jgi:ubiquinone/menaquinone biosynthesis C-methylase UbiE/uncharacterized protein YbaR (Trm112 family)